MKSVKLVISFVFFAALLFMSINNIKADQDMEVCGPGGDFKSYMSIGKMNKSSAKYKYLMENTSVQDNLLVTNDGYHAVAMGSYYGGLGDKFHITLASGQVVKVVKVEGKADQHTSKACYGKTDAANGSILEFVVKTYETGKHGFTSLSSGNVGKAYPRFGGNIVKIVKVSGSKASTQKPTQQTNSFDDGEGPDNLLKIKQQQEQEAKRVAEAQRIAEVKRVEKAKADAIAEELRIQQEEEQKLMALFLPDAGHDKLVFLDTEFMEGRDLVQAAFIIYERADDLDHFFLTTSLNVFVNRPVTPAFEAYTGIKAGFLGNEGLTRDQARRVINAFAENNSISGCNTLIIGHGVNQDLMVLETFGCKLQAPHYDTLSAAKTILQRDTKLKLSDLLLDAGLIQGDAHDAYQDARNTIPVYEYLKWVEYRRREERF